MKPWTVSRWRDVLSPAKDCGMRAAKCRRHRLLRDGRGRAAFPTHYALIAPPKSVRGGRPIPPTWRRDIRAPWAALWSRPSEQAITTSVRALRRWAGSRVGRQRPALIGEFRVDRRLLARYLAPWAPGDAVAMWPVLPADDPAAKYKYRALVVAGPTWRVLVLGMTNAWPGEMDECWPALEGNGEAVA